MKTLGNNATRVIVGTLTASVLVESCNSQYNFEDSIYGPYDEMMIVGGRCLMSVEESNLTSQTIHYVESLSKIFQEIISDRDVAINFCKNPQKYLESKEIYYEISLTNQEKTLLSALADEDIFQAIKENNIRDFLQIARDKGYIKCINITKHHLEHFNSIFKSDKDFKNFLNDLNNSENPQSSVYSAAFFPAVTVAILALGVLVYVAAATIAAVEVAAGVQAATLYHISTYTQTSTQGVESMTTTINNINNKAVVLKLWLDNNGPIAVSDFYSEIIDNQVEYLVNIIKDMYPDADAKIVSKVLRNNIEGYYGLR